MHTIRIGAPRDMTGGSSPALLQRSDDDFIEATLDDLRTAGGRQALQAMRARATDAGGVLKLFQPIQRQFHVVVIEAWCDQPGAPRVDPSLVKAAGMVLRRVGAGGREGWMRSNGRVRGWIPVQRIGGDLADPAAAQRLAAKRSGVADIDRAMSGFALQGADSRLNEHAIPLYLAPPDVCTDAGKTLFYGIVPTASAEFSEADAQIVAEDDGFGPLSPEFAAHLAGALSGQGMAFPFPGDTLAAGWLEALQSPGSVAPSGVSDAQFQQLANNPNGSDAVRMRTFVRMLQQLGSEFNAFDGGSEVDALRQQLREIQLPLVQREGEAVQRTVNAYDFLAAATAVLLAKDRKVQAPEMPESWPSSADTGKLLQALHGAMAARFAGIQAKAGRFDDPGSRYVVRAFVRLGCETTGCSKLFWSDETEPFVIAPWYEGGGAPPVQIALPDASDKNLLKALKPNVSFVVPPSLQNLLGGKPKDLLEGKGDMGTLGLSWICSFNIPIITICAFIALNILLSLFNLIFGWMFSMKICIPFPKLGNKPPAQS